MVSLHLPEPASVSFVFCRLRAKRKPFARREIIEIEAQRKAKTGGVGTKYAPWNIS
jgi:hypothetical protein